MLYYCTVVVGLAKPTNAASVEASTVGPTTTYRGSKVIGLLVLLVMCCLIGYGIIVTFLLIFLARKHAILRSQTNG